MAAHPVQALPEGPDWGYEPKLDGYRCILLKRGPQVAIRSRNDKNLTAQFPAVTRAAAALPADRVVVDGELVALDPEGRPSFQALQNRATLAFPIVFFAFDLLQLEDRDLKPEPLTLRRKALERLIPTDSAALKLCEELHGTCAQVVAAVRNVGLEGVVAKRRSSPYRPGQRSRDWLKLKLDRQQEFVIGGYRPDGLNSIDALLVGYYENSELLFAAKVRAGLVRHSRHALAADLTPLQTSRCPFVDLPTPRSRWGSGVPADEMRQMRWVSPELVAQIRFVEWTDDQRLRHPSYLGLRKDKAPSDVRKEL